MEENEEGKNSRRQILAVILIVLILSSMIISLIIAFSHYFSFTLLFIIFLVGTALVALYYIITRIKNKKKRERIILFKKYLLENLEEIKISSRGSIKNCKVCKLEIKPHHVATQCPNCKNCFHKKHLITWLVQNPYCPVCNYKFDYEMPEKSKDSQLQSE
ncbi:MAG: hypothetical protein JXA54_01875 [Candidatus Heimdallarchaeota archaeon]|nr:hypothetical protein [Candidatus Heimdallarchaeota archaeon]